MANQKDDVPEFGEHVIPDDSGIIAVVDGQRYRSFIGPNWTLVTNGSS